VSKICLRLNNKNNRKPFELVKEPMRRQEISRLERIFTNEVHQRIIKQIEIKIAKQSPAY